MSASIAISKAQYQGDPGIFGSIFGGIKRGVRAGLGVASVLPGVGGFASAARNILFPGDARINIPGASTLPSLPRGVPIGSAGIAMPGTGFGGGGRPGPTMGPAGPCPPGQSRGFNPPFLGPPGVGVDLPFLGRYSLGESPMAQDQFQVTTAMLAGKPTGWPGYHWNKSSYFLMSGEYVPAGTRAVRNRRRNPCNPRAVSRALSRVKSAKRFAASISHVSIRKRSKH